jgi:TolB protein
LGVPAGEIYVMPLTGGQQINLTNSPALDGEPAWGPEEPALGLLTFTSLRLNLLNFLQLDLYIVESDRTITNYTNLETQDRQAAWSPDGFVLLYDSFRSIDNFSPEQWDIHLWDGINFVNLSNSPATDQMPAWAPDQTRIAYVSDRNGANDIFVQDLTGGLLQNISQSAAQDLHPAFSPDGNQIAFISDRDGSWGVYIMDANGGNVRLVINGFEFADSPNWVPLLEGEDLLLGEVDLLLGAVLRSGLKTPTGRRTAA